VLLQGDATRNHSQKMLNALASVIPGFLGGSADLAPSNMTLMKAFGDFQKDSKSGDKDRIGGYAERNLRFGVREHAMGAICNGANIGHGIDLSIAMSSALPMPRLWQCQRGFSPQWAQSCDGMHVAEQKTDVVIHARLYRLRTQDDGLCDGS
jgi:hypothetical protein